MFFKHILLNKKTKLKIKHLSFPSKINDKLTPPVLCDENPIYEYRMNQVFYRALFGMPSEQLLTVLCVHIVKA